MKQLSLFSLFLTAVLAGTEAHAQHDVLAELYGMGYHAFFRHDFHTAHERLTKAIDEGSQDPRAYYYRGLTNLCMGNQDAADIDFRDGAALEAEGYGRGIGRALDRIQGYHRLRIERARFAARLEEARRRGFQQPAPAPRALPPVPASPAPPPSQEAIQPAIPAPQEVVPPAVAPEADPFPVDDAPPAADDLGAPAEEDPFGAPAEVEDDAEMSEEDPFGGSEDMDEDPFGSVEF